MPSDNQTVDDFVYTSLTGSFLMDERLARRAASGLEKIRKAGVSLDFDPEEVCGLTSMVVELKEYDPETGMFLAHQVDKYGLAIVSGTIDGDRITHKTRYIRDLNGNSFTDTSFYAECKGTIVQNNGFLKLEGTYVFPNSEFKIKGTWTLKSLPVQ